MNAVLGPLLWLFNTVIQLYLYIVIAAVVLSWLVAFNVVNTRNRFVYMLGDVLNRLTEPALRPIRRLLPNLGGVDLSPMLLILGLLFTQQVVNGLVLQYVAPAL